MSSSATNDIKKLELEIRKQELQQAHDFNLKGMEAQSNYKNQEMGNRFKLFYWVLGSTIVCFLAIVALVISCVMNSKEQFALEFFKSVVLPIFTGIGGYLAGRQRSTAAQSKPVVLEERNE
jgi:hypothetical protein